MAGSKSLQFIEVPPLDPSAQVLEAFDVSKGDAWFDGLNAFCSPAELNRLVHSLLHSELESGDLNLTEARPRFGRGLFNMKYVAEGHRS